MGQNEVNSIIASLLLSGQGFGVWAIYKHFAHGRVSASWGAEANAPVPAFWDEKITMLVQPEGAALKQGGMPAIIDGVIGRFFTPDFVAKNTIELKRVVPDALKPRVLKLKAE
jgi:hypothetical protein